MASLLRSFFLRCVFVMATVFVNSSLYALELTPPEEAEIEQDIIIRASIDDMVHLLGDVKSFVYFMPEFSNIFVESTYQTHSLAQVYEFVAVSNKPVGPLSFSQYHMGSLVVDKIQSTITLQWRRPNGEEVTKLFRFKKVNAGVQATILTRFRTTSDDLPQLILQEQSSASVRLDVVKSLLEEGVLIDVHSCQLAKNRFCF